MIVQEHFTINERDFIRTYSNSGHYVIGGEPYGEYEEVCDPAECGRTYVEGGLIPFDKMDIESKAEAYDILMGAIE